MPKGEAEVYRPAEACRIAEVAPYVLRYWETEFPALSEGRDKGSAKLYTARDVRIIARIRELLYDEGFTVAGAKKRLDAEITEGRFDNGLAPAPPVREQRAEKPPAASPASSEKPSAPKAAPAGPVTKPAPPPPAAARPAPQKAAAPEAPRREEKPAQPGFDRKMVVRELKEIVRLLGRP